MFMNDLVKASIDGRKQSFYTAYDINNDNIKNKIEDLFKRIEEFGSSCTDSADFETKFATSPLNQEYINLFTEVATTCPAKQIEHAEVHVKSDAEYLADDAAMEARCMVDDLTMPARRQARQEAYDAARDMPIIGEAMTAKQHFDFFSRFKKKKDDE
jgi:hypothetical protein